MALVIFAYTIKQVSEMDLGFTATASGGSWNDVEWKKIQVFFPGWTLFADLDYLGFLPLPPVLIFTGCAVWTGISHTFGVWKRKGASTPNEASLLQREQPSGFVDLDGVDLFDYREVVEFSLNTCGGFSIWVLYQLASFLFACAWFFWLAVSFSFSSRGPYLSAGLALTFALWLSGCTYLLLRNFGLLRRFSNLREACRTQPRSYAVKGLLLEFGMWYATVLYFSPAPPVWRWSLIVTHIARSLKLLYSLRNRGEAALGAGGKVEEAGEVVETP